MTKRASFLGVLLCSFQCTKNYFCFFRASSCFFGCFTLLINYLKEAATHKKAVKRSRKKQQITLQSIKRSRKKQEEAAKKAAKKHLKAASLLEEAGRSTKKHKLFLQLTVRQKI